MPQNPKSPIPHVDAAEPRTGGVRVGVPRFDLSELSKPVKRDNGWLEVEGYIGRSGLLTYRKDDGSPWVEYRPPEEAFNPETLRSFRLVPLTNGHPKTASGLLDAGTAAGHQVGSVEQPTPDGDKLRARMLVTDASTIEDMENGNARQLSCGYMADVDPTPGEINGQHYDAIQRNVRGNHVALVPVGRAGADCSVRMDSLTAVLEPSVTAAPPASGNAVKVKIDGVEYEVPNAVARMFANQIARLEARTDAAEDKAKRLAAELTTVPEKIRAGIEARAKLERDARSVLGEGAKLDSLSDLEIKRRVVSYANHTDVSDKSADYLQGAFESAVATFEPGVFARTDGPTTSGLDSAEPFTSLAAAAEKFMDARANAYRADK